LNHPNIATLHGIEDLGDGFALVLEYVSGQTLADRLDRGPVPLAATLEIAGQIAGALEAAHERGVVHRDLKPANVQLRQDGTVKLLDFGLAKVFEPAPGDTNATDVTATAMAGHAIVGTPAYMSPEQARGLPVDKRTDVWAFGCVLYELLSRQRAFSGDHVSDVMAKILGREPDFAALPSGTSPELRRLLERCLAKDERRRLRDIGDARLEIEEMLAATRPGSTVSVQAAAEQATAPRPVRRSRRRVVALTAVLGVAAIGLTFYWLSTRDRRWVVEYAIPQIEKHLDVTDWESAYALAKQAEARDPDNPELAGLWTRIGWRVTIPSDPPGATVYRQAYSATSDKWETLGRTPLEKIHIPYGLSRLRFELPGYKPMLRAIGGEHLNWAELRGFDELLDQLLVGPDANRLDADAATPPGKVRVPGWTLTLKDQQLKLQDFYLDDYEVTNAEFKAFVDAGGYSRPDLWAPIVVHGVTVPFGKAAAMFTDHTGRPGPSTWEAGDYPAGGSEYPVSGVSWYEAAAYARFRGEELPTAYHWHRALATSMFPALLPLSNFQSDGPRPVAMSRAMSYVGAFDMPGNVREWTVTALGNERVILGGSWNDPAYIADTPDTSAPPLDRSPGNGIRLALTRDEPAITALVMAPMESRHTASPELTREPVSDQIFAAYGRIFDYTRGPLNASIEKTDRTRLWTRQRVAYDAGYGNGSERVLLDLYLPSAVSPPYQTVVYWPGWDTFGLDDPGLYFAKQLDFIVKNGRAVAFPIYRGTFERRVGNIRGRPEFDTTAWRDNAIEGVKDMRRTVDYLETRPDIDRATLSFFGYSWGGVNGPIALAHESRFKAGVIDIGLLPPMTSVPEVDPLNALPRVRVPTLMLSGEFDGMVPVANARRYFELLGGPNAEKKHVISPGGHFVPRHQLIRETLDWLDRHLGRPGH
jgi:pimeloyl-ACP methyl ester carboxylesterase